MKTYARLRNFGVPALKVRRFGQTIKGEPVVRALAILDLQPSPTCQALGKLLRSAIANAQNNNQLSPEFLVVSNVMVDQGPTMKRIRPRARGRAYRVLKRSSHVTIELDLKTGITAEGPAPVEAETKPKRKRSPKAGAKSPAEKQKTSESPGKTEADTASKRATKAKPAKPAASEKDESAVKPAKTRAKKTTAKAKTKTKKDTGSKE